MAKSIEQRIQEREDRDEIKELDRPLLLARRARRR